MAAKPPEPIQPISPVKRKRITRTTKELTQHLLSLSGYNPNYHPEAAYRFALLGCDDKRIAELLEISKQHFDRWVKHLPAFKKALYEGQEDADAKVVSQVFRKACGYVFEEEVYERQAIYEDEYDEDGLFTGEQRFVEFDMIKVKHTKKEVPPDTTAAALFLTNRTRNRPVNERWSNRQEITGADGLPFMPTEVLDERAKEARQTLLEQAKA
jgi:hypothetical protein